jgi:cyclo(L-tyrosyl-L-tyrosyl) synthase
MILNWEMLQKNAVFLKKHQKVIHHFETEPAFREACLMATEWVLQGKVKNTDELTLEQRLKSVKYFLAEIPLFANTVEIVDVESSIFCYHQPLSFLEKLYLRHFGYQPAKNKVMESSL